MRPNQPGAKPPISTSRSDSNNKPPGRNEPDRADHQRDLVISLLRQASIETGEPAAAALARALNVLETLHVTGRLNPADAAMLADLRQRPAPPTA